MTKEEKENYDVRIQTVLWNIKGLKGVKVTKDEMDTLINLFKAFEYETNVADFKIKFCINYKAFAYGSRVVCNPAPEDSDLDIGIYLERHQYGFNMTDVILRSILKKANFVEDTTGYELSEGAFKSFRSGNVNLVLLGIKTFMNPMLKLQSYVKN